MRYSNDSFRTLALLGLLLTTLAPSALPSPEPGARTSITVRLYDYASTDRGLLARAVRVAAQILRNGGVSTRWEQCRTREEGPVLNPACAKRADAAVLQLRLQTKEQSKRLKLRAWQFGYAVPTDQGFGVIAGVFIHKARHLARRQRLDLPIVLGHLMAHELGHLLLGSGRHSGQGIMRPRWSNGDLRRAQTGIFGFTAPQARRMQTQAAARAAESLDGVRLHAGAERGTLFVSAGF